MGIACVRSGRLAEKSVTAIFERTGLRRLHLQPLRRSIAGVAPNMTPLVMDSGGDQSVVTRRERVALVTDLEGHVSFQYVVALFEGMKMRLNLAAWIQVTDPHAHVNRSHG